MVSVGLAKLLRIKLLIYSKVEGASPLKGFTIRIIIVISFYLSYSQLMLIKWFINL
jgi:hypothetical protein